LSLTLSLSPIGRLNGNRQLFCRLLLRFEGHNLTINNSFRDKNACNGYVLVVWERFSALLLFIGWQRVFFVDALSSCLSGSDFFLSSGRSFSF
jgi:hypothetical protein